MMPKIILENVRMSALREKVKFYALLFDIPIHTVQIEVQGTFKTREDNLVFLKGRWHIACFMGQSKQIFAQLDGESEWTTIIPENSVIEQVRLSGSKEHNHD